MGRGSCTPDGKEEPDGSTFYVGALGLDLYGMGMRVSTAQHREQDGT